VLPDDGINGVFGPLNRRAEGKIEFIQARREEMAAFMASGSRGWRQSVSNTSAVPPPGFRPRAACRGGEIARYHDHIRRSRDLAEKIVMGDGAIVFHVRVANRRDFALATSVRAKGSLSVKAGGDALRRRRQDRQLERIS
jgi:hypothetical protein